MHLIQLHRLAMGLATIFVTVSMAIPIIQEPLLLAFIISLDAPHKLRIPSNLTQAATALAHATTAQEVVAFWDGFSRACETVVDKIFRSLIEPVDYLEHGKTTQGGYSTTKTKRMETARIPLFG